MVTGFCCSAEAYMHQTQGRKLFKTNLKFREHRIFSKTHSRIKHEQVGSDIIIYVVASDVYKVDDSNCTMCLY